jgi:hypothetical protein
MEEWKNGRMEEWKNGRVEEWNIFIISNIPTFQHSISNFINRKLKYWILKKPFRHEIHS